MAFRSLRIPSGELRRLWLDGVPLADLCARYGCTDQAIRRRARAMGLPKRVPRPPIILDGQEFVSMYLAGVSFDEIARHFGASRAGVRHAKRRLGLPCRVPGRAYRKTVEEWRWEQARARMAAIAAAEQQEAKRRAA